MKTETKSITVDKTQHEVELKEFESFDELMMNVSAPDILEHYNFRYKQLQCQDEKKRLKPRRIPVKEKRAYAFNLFTDEELAETANNAGRFEAYMDEKLLVIEQQIKDKEII